MMTQTSRWTLYVLIVTVLKATIPCMAVPQFQPFTNLHPQTRASLSDTTTTIQDITTTSITNPLFILRGGASKKRPNKSRTATLSSTSSSRTATGKKKVGASDAEKKSKTGDLVQKYKKILPLTRIYITMVVTATFIGLILGEELTQSLLALNPTRVIYGLELWRPFTAASFLGPPSIGWLMNGYYLVQYGSSLERAYGTPQQLIFLLSQMILLSIFSALLGMPFFAPSMITAMLHVLSRATPHQNVKWLVFNVPYWTLPYGLMLTDVLQAKSAAAAIPHILGILSGHFYQFHKFIWPKVGGEDWLIAPDFLVQKFDPNAKKSKDTAKKASKTKRKGKGRKLGSKK